MSRLIVDLSILEDNKKIKTFFLDADMLVYTIGFAVEDKMEWPDGEIEYLSDNKSARRLIDNRISYFKHQTSKKFKCVITGREKNWRLSTVDKTYKASRGRKPVAYKAIRDHLQKEHNAIVSKDGLEADDLLGVEVTKNKTSCIISFDKDFFTVPGAFIHLGTKRLYRPTVSQSLCFLFFQALAGDRVDGYFGVDWVGPSKARKILDYCLVNKLTIRQSLLAIKKFIKLRQKLKNAKDVDLWKQFQNSLDLACIVWHNEEVGKGIGIRRIRKHSKEKFDYFLPYYEPSHSRKFGIEHLK